MTTHNFSNIAVAISPHLNDDCLEVLNELGEQARAQALAAWESEICPETGHLEIGARYSKTGNPVTVQFTIVNDAEIRAAVEAEADEIPSPIYAY